MKNQNVVLKVGIGLVLGIGAIAFAPQTAHAAQPCPPQNCPSATPLCYSQLFVSGSGLGFFCSICPDTPGCIGSQTYGEIDTYKCLDTNPPTYFSQYHQIVGPNGTPCP